jgi:hypothetical protein
MIWIRPWRSVNAWPSLVTHEVGHHDALRGVLVFHDPGEGAYCLHAHRAAVALGLDYAQATEDRVLVDCYRVDAIILGGLGYPGLHAHLLEELADQVLGANVSSDRPEPQPRRTRSSSARASGAGGRTDVPYSTRPDTR